MITSSLNRPWHCGSASWIPLLVCWLREYTDAQPNGYQMISISIIAGGRSYGFLNECLPFQSFLPLQKITSTLLPPQTQFPQPFKIQVPHNNGCYFHSHGLGAFQHTRRRNGFLFDYVAALRSSGSSNGVPFDFLGSLPHDDNVQLHYSDIVSVSAMYFPAPPN